MSLQRNLIAAILAVLLASLVVGAALTYEHAVGKVRTELQAAMAVGRRIVQNAAADGEEPADPLRRSALIVGDFNGDRHLRATLRNPQGRVTLTSTLQRPEDVAPRFFFDLVSGPPMVDDHSVVREGLRRLLANAVEADLFEAESHHAAQAVFHAEKPDVVILDLNIPGGGGLDLLRRFLTEHPPVRVLIFSMHGSASYVMNAMQAGAYGYVTKSASATELLDAIGKVMAGSRYLQRDLVTELAASPVWSKGPRPPLSNRELDILRLLAQGDTLSEIAAQLGASYKTIANACTGIKEKLMVERTGDLIRVAIEMNAQ